MIRRPLGDRARNQESSASALARRYMASKAADSASSRAACAKSIASVKRIGLGHIGIRRRLMGVEPILVFLDVAKRQD